LLDEYLKAVNLLTIDSESTILNNHIQILQEKNKENEYIIQGRLQERDQQIELLTEQFSSMKKVVIELVKGLSETKDQSQINSVVKSLYSSGLFQKGC
jgi:hypothetical protein